MNKHPLSPSNQRVLNVNKEAKVSTRKPFPLNKTFKDTVIESAPQKFLKKESLNIHLLHGPATGMKAKF